MAVIGKISSPGEKPKRRSRRLRYVQTLPTLCTLANLLCGFAAIHMCLRAMWLVGGTATSLEIIARDSQLIERLLPTHVVMAAYLIFLAMIFDALDGRLARLTRHTTDFGAQLDSLADVISFGVAPALLIITLLTRQLQGETPLVLAPLSPSLFGRLAWIMIAVYVACATLRLARFNVETATDDLDHLSFRGLPTPGAAAAVACLVILHDHLYFYDKTGVSKTAAEQGGPLSEWILWILPVLAVALGLLMVSRFQYAHLVNRYLRGRRSFAGMVKALFVVAAVVVYPEVVITLLVVSYALSGPTLAGLRRLGAAPAADEDEEEEITDDPQELAG